jgi:hypothetical protein
MAEVIRRLAVIRENLNSLSSENLLGRSTPPTDPFEDENASESVIEAIEQILAPGLVNLGGTALRPTWSITSQASVRPERIIPPYSRDHYSQQPLLKGPITPLSVRRNRVNGAKFCEELGAFDPVFQGVTLNPPTTPEKPNWCPKPGSVRRLWLRLKQRVENIMEKIIKPSRKAEQPRTFEKLQGGLKVNRRPS